LAELKNTINPTKILVPEKIPVPDKTIYDDARNFNKDGSPKAVSNNLLNNLSNNLPKYLLCVFYPHTLINSPYSPIHRLFSYESKFHLPPEGKFYPQATYNSIAKMLIPVTLSSPNDKASPDKTSDREYSSSEAYGRTALPY
jgi:hypothetical protein